MTMKPLTAFLVSLLLTTSMAWGQNAYFIPSARFSSGLINDICQDRRGIMWVATDYGLNRFDGYQFLSFLHSEADSASISSNFVVALLCDKSGNVWAGTRVGLDRYDASRDCFVHYPFPDNATVHVSSIVQRRDGTLLVGTAGYGAYVLRDGDGGLTAFDGHHAGDNFYSRMFEDSQGRLWKSGTEDQVCMYDGSTFTCFYTGAGNPRAFGEADGRVLVACQHGLLKYEDGRFLPIPFDDPADADNDIVLARITIDEHNRVYVGTRGKGVYSVDRPLSDAAARLKPVTISATGINPATAKVYAMYADRDNNLWLGCHRKGILFVPRRQAQFQSWTFESQGIRIGSTVSSLCEGDDGMMWCTVQGVGVYGFSRDGRVVATPPSPDAVEFIFRDRQGDYWLGTADALYAYDPLTGRSQRRVAFDCDRFNDMTDCGDGNIYLSAFSRGFCIYNKQSHALRHYSFTQADTLKGTLCNDWIMAMMPDRRGKVWLATSNGVSCFDPRSGSFRSEGWEVLLANTMCYALCETSRGNILIGTNDGLYLYDTRQHEVERFHNGTEIEGKAVSYIVESNDGDIWCSTSDGIWHYSAKTHRFSGHVNGNGLTQREYIIGVGIHTDDDRILFGHSDGITAFSPKDITDSSETMSPIELVALRVGDQYVNSSTVVNGIRVTDEAVGESSHFTLSYLDHTVTLSFSQFKYENPRNLQLEYRLNGEDWCANPKGKNNFTLSHLQPGTYRLTVRARQGNSYSPEREFTIHVQSPWYSSTLAWIVYIVLAVLLLFFVLQAYRRRANEHLNEEKMKFLINATHDIRSPLTLIMGPLMKLRNERTDTFTDISQFRDYESGVLRPSLQTIEHNAQRILDLVNQILDVRKIDKQQMQLHCRETDLVAFCKGIYKMFEYSARERGITFRLVPPADDKLPLTAWIDRRQMDKVVTNLLSNAFKYTYNGGSVDISLDSSDDKAVIRVADDGVGMDGDTMKHIFDRFYQGSNSRRLNIDGTGIGLNLCKMIVDLHHGNIYAESRPDGAKGTVLVVELPVGTDHLTESQIERTEGDANGGAANVHPVRSQSKYSVLVVDDDLEIGRYVSLELGRYYKFGIAQNGKEGLKMLLTGNYDVVVSDVMMPEMDGFTMLRMIRTNLNISHIPVIMLTSKADVGNRLEGLGRGANAFLAKPFDIEELHMHIENVISHTRLLKGKFSGAQQQADKVEQPEVRGNDEELMDRIMKVVNKHLGDSDFTVDMLTQEACISRTQLHRKMKELTGLSTSEFIRNLRLEQAARLLREQKINVTQVAYTVGFSNLAHFSTVFHKHFGMTPSEYIAKK